MAICGKFDRVPELVREVLALNTVVIVTLSNPVTRAAKGGTQTVPIVMLAVDPVEDGLIDSFARPSGNVTGVAPDTGIENFGKWVQLLKELVPGMFRVAYLESKGEALSGSKQSTDCSRAIARKFGLTMHAPLGTSTLQ